MNRNRDGLVALEPASISVNAEFYRKLQQQIVQKDNIIKLLRLQLENLKAAAVVGGRGAVAAGADPLAAAARAELEEELNALRREVGSLRTALAAAEQRAAAIGPAPSVARERGERAELLEELAARNASESAWAARCEQAERALSAARSEGQAAAAERSRLEARLQELPGELTRRAAAEAAVEAAVEELRSENRRLHRRLEEGRAEGAAASAERERALAELTEARRRLASLPAAERVEAERDELRQKAAALQAHLTAAEARAARAEAAMAEVQAAAHERLAATDLRLLGGVIELRESLLRANAAAANAAAAAAGSVGASSSPGGSAGAAGPGALSPEDEALFAGTFEALALRRISAVGERFDPARHQAVGQVVTAEHPDGTVLEERSAGFASGGATIKPAEVVVSRHPCWCSRCARAAGDGSRFCNLCGARLAPVEGATGERPPAEQAAEHVRLGAAREAAGDVEEAVQSYSRALGLVDSCAPALRAMARLREHEGRFEEAQECWERLSRSGPLGPAEQRALRRLRLKLEIVGKVREIF